MLHIHNGDSTADTAKLSSVPGEHLAWRESLITGPTPSAVSENEWRRVRARHLSEAYGINAEECERGLLGQEETLSSFAEHDEAVLWFEHDLFCQLHLLYLLNWFAHRGPGETKLSVVCIGEFPGREKFRGLGELTSDELASLFPKRQQVTRPQFELAAAGWQAYCSAKPTDIENLLRTDTSDLPFLDAALHAHLKRFPATKNGLGRIENRALQFSDEGAESFSDLFSKFGETEPVYGLGDAQFWLALRRLATTQQPLLKVVGLEKELLNQETLTPELARRARFSITDLGQAVLAGETDFVAVSQIDLWLGGVHLLGGDDLWRWDDKAESLTQSDHA